VAEQGATLKKDGEIVSAVHDGQTIARIPVRALEAIVILGNVGLTTPMLSFLLRSNVDCVFCSSEGAYRGRLVSTESAFGELRRLQLQATLDVATALSVARQCVRGKVLNQRTILLRHARLHGNDVSSQSAAALEQALQRIDGAPSLALLRGIEGQAAVTFFKGFRSLLRDAMGFEKRARRPPPDPVNSLLSFGYTLLMRDALSAIRIAGLDPYIGFLHQVRYSTPSLALDLAEEFRPVLVDSLVLQVLNSRILTAADFERRGEPEGVYMSRTALSRFIEQYERRLLTKLRRAGASSEEVTYRRVIELQARLLAAVVQKKRAGYQPWLVK